MRLEYRANRFDKALSLVDVESGEVEELDSSIDELTNRAEISDAVKLHFMH